MLTVIGIDPGLADTGIGVVSGHGMKVDRFAFGSITTQKEHDLTDRLEIIYAGLSEVIQAEKPDLMIVEDVFSLARYPKSGITLGKVTGVILLAGRQANIPVGEVPVREAKKVLTGNGAADKAQLEMAVRRFLGATAPIRPFHASDALALALIGLFRHHP
ncbi:crossover junction endodeoxyribonuclease RuvC [Desulfococcus sp.]|uniref:crossover junction endodeoxyribonuclease RuvC n=1 Tax=Desulfococcus sp. TaxID=2025834 RepID=UPI003592F74D